MANNRRTKIILPNELFAKYQKQVNYLRSNLTSIASLGLYLNKNDNLTEEQVNYYLKSIEEKDTKMFYIYFSPYIIDLYKHKVRYLSTYDEFISANIMHFVLSDYLNESDDITNQKMKALTISEELIKEIDDLSETLGINVSTMINYGLKYIDFDKIPYQPVSYNRERKHVNINELQRDKMPKDTDEKEQIIAKIIYYMKNN